MQTSNIPAKFPIPFANAAGAGFIRTIPEASQIGIQDGAASLTDGFVPDNFQSVSGGGVPPFGQDFNGILKQITQWNQWQQAGGPIAWDSTFSTDVTGYPKGSLVQGTTSGSFYYSTAENNTTNPNTGGAGWVTLSSLILANAALTGNPTAPTQPVNTGNTTVANTFYADRSATNAANAVLATAEAYTLAQLANYLPLIGGTLSGALVLPTLGASDGSTKAVNAFYADRGDANTLTAAENFALTLVGNLAGSVTYTTSSTQPTSDYGSLINMGTAATGAVALILPARVAGKQMVYVNQNTSFNLILFGAGSDTFIGLTGAKFGTAVGNFTVPPRTIVYIQGGVGNWIVTLNSNTIGNYAGVTNFNNSATVPITAFGTVVIMQSTATGITTLTVPSPAGQPGQKLLLQNISSFTETITTPAGFFYGLKSTTSFTIPAGNSAEIVSDGVNYDVTYSSDAFAGAGVLAAQMLVPGGINSALIFERSTTWTIGTSYAGSTFTGLGYSGSWVCLGNCAITGGFIGAFQRAS